VEDKTRDKDNRARLVSFENTFNWISLPQNFTILSETFAQESLDDSLVEPPMPSIPPPPPPPAEYLEALDDLSLDVPKETESFGIALYDYNGDQVDDLNFKVRDISVAQTFFRFFVVTLTPICLDTHQRHMVFKYNKKNYQCVPVVFFCVLALISFFEKKYKIPGTLTVDKIDKY
jgi:hypothetical protein